MHTHSMLFVGVEMAPGPDVNSDDEILDWVRNNSETTSHPVGTRKMGKDDQAVVDSRLRVHGARWLARRRWGGVALCECRHHFVNEACQ